VSTKNSFHEKMNSIGYVTIEKGEIVGEIVPVQGRGVISLSSVAFSFPGAKSILCNVPLLHLKKIGINIAARIPMPVMMIAVIINQ
jgi:hypothetical protein